MLKVFEINSMIVLTIILCCNIVLGLKSSNQSIYYTVLKKIPSKLVVEAEKELFTRSSELFASGSANNRRGAYYKSKHSDTQEQDYKHTHYYPKAGRSNHYKGNKYSYDDDDHYHDDSYHDHHHYHHHKKNQKHKYDHDKSYGMKFGGYHLTFFDLALGGLATLAFGVYLLNGLFNLISALGAGMFVLTGTGTGTGTATGTATGPIITTTGITTTGGGTGATGRRRSTDGRRNRRSVFKLYLDPVTSVDSLANTVLKSIDAMVNKHECVQKVFCDGNKQARLIKHGFEYLMPVYCIGASYIGEKLGLHEKLPEHINAILLGVNESNCQSHFPQC